MNRIRVVVTAQDIAQGAPHDAGACPIALALHRTGFRQARVYPSRVPLFATWMPNRKIGRRSLSRRASDFAMKVDRGDPVEPSTFYIEGPAQ